MSTHIEIEKERISTEGFVPPWVHQEHRARFDFAAKYVHDLRVVDCACGTGVGSEIFAHAGAKQILAFDVSDSAIAEAMREHAHPTIAYQTAGAESLPIASDKTDVYISLETIEHLEDVGPYLTETKRVLKQGGIFLCSTPNRLVTNPGKSLADKPANIYHVREYSTAEFFDLLKMTFPTVELYGINKHYRPLTKIFASADRIFRAIGIPHGGTRLHQAMKLLMHPLRGKDYYAVSPIDERYEYEYLVAVCHS